MRYDPKTADTFLLPEGEYDIVCVTGEEKKSSKNNPMLVLTWKVFGPREILVNSYFCSNVSAMMSKLRKVCRACDLDFDSGSLGPDEFIGKQCRGLVKIQTDETGKFDDQNVIAAYLKEDSSVPKNTEEVENKNNNGIPDDDIPF